MTALIDWLVSTFQAQPLHFALQVTGVIGSCVYVCGFFLVQSGRICGNGVLYPFMQMFAANCILASLTTAFNLAAVIVQVSFILIAAFGIWYRLTGRISARLERRVDDTRRRANRRQALRPDHIKGPAGRAVAPKLLVVTADATLGQEAYPECNKSHDNDAMSTMKLG